MKKVLIISFLVVAGVLLAPGLVIRMATVVAEVSVGDAEAVREYAAGWGLPVGAPAPEIDAQDHTGARRSLGSLAGDRGLLLFMVRSADW